MLNNCEKITDKLKDLSALTSKLNLCVSSSEAKEGLSIKKLLSERLQGINSENYMKPVRYKRLIALSFSPDYIDKSDLRITWDGNIEMIRKFFDRTEILTTEEETKSYLLVLSIAIQSIGEPREMKTKRIYALHVVSKVNQRVHTVYLNVDRPHPRVKIISCEETAQDVYLTIGIGQEEEGISVSHDKFKSLTEMHEDIKRRRMSI